MSCRYTIEVSAEAPSLRVNTQSTPAFVVDNTPALVGTINDGAMVANGTLHNCRHCAQDLDYTANATTFFTNWCCGFEDKESGVVAYEWALSRSNFTFGNFGGDQLVYNATNNDTSLLTRWVRTEGFGNGTGRADFIEPLPDRTTVYVPVRL